MRARPMKIDQRFDILPESSSRMDAAAASPQDIPLQIERQS